MALGRLTGAQILARTLALAGVRETFTIAGDHVLPVLDEMADGGFRLIDTRHEQAAAHMADTWARITGKPGVVIATTPGFANVVPALANAVHSERPLLSIGGSAELAELGRGAMQEIDQVGMARPVTKLSEMVTDPRRIPDTVARALRLAYAGRRGPVHLTIPLDLQRIAVPAAEVDFTVVTDRHARPVGPADPAAVHSALDLLAAAKRPVAIAGGAATYSRSGDALARFAEATRTPVMTEGDARGLIADDHPWCAGFYDTALSWAARLVREADAVVLIGRKQDLVTRYAAPPGVAAAARLIQIDPDVAEIGRNRPVDVGLAGDTDAVLAQLADAAASRVWDARDEWRERLNAERRRMDAWLADLAGDTEPMHAMAVFTELRTLLGRQGSIVFEGGDFCHFGRAYVPAWRPLAWSYFSTFGMLGTGLPSAMAMKLARPDTNVVLATGDGGFGFNGFELDTAVRHGINVALVLGNDAAWGIDRQIQLGVYGRAVVTDLLPTRYDVVARGLGARSFNVRRREELRPALQAALAADRPALVNVAISCSRSPRSAAAVERWRAFEQRQPHAQVPRTDGNTSAQ